jgi:hypothetical protein
MSKTEINVQPIIDGIKSNCKGILKVVTLKGKNKKEGHFMLMLFTDDKFRINIDVDVAEMMRNKHYMDKLFENIAGAMEYSRKARYEACRMGF